MKYIFITFLLVFAYGNMHSQTYHKMLGDSNRWNEGVFRRDQWGNLNWNTNILTAKKDSIVNSIHYKWIHGNYFGIYGNVDGFLREDTIKKRIYYKRDSKSPEMLLYDFSLNTGDTIKFDFANSSDTSVAYHVSYRSSSISSQDTIILDLNSNQKFHSLFFPDNQMTWIEGIGSTRSLLFPTEFYGVDGPGFELLCSYQNGIQSYSNSDGLSCVLFTDINNEAKLIPFITLSPNPSCGYYTLNLPENFSGEVLIFDMLGNIKYHARLEDMNKLEINLNAPAGIYLMKVNSTDGNVSTLKLIKY